MKKTYHNDDAIFTKLPTVLHYFLREHDDSCGFHPALPNNSLFLYGKVWQRIVNLALENRLITEKEKKKTTFFFIIIFIFSSNELPGV